MAGSYTPGEKKVLSGVYSLIIEYVEKAASSTRGIVAYPFTSNWGVTNKLVETDDSDVFGDAYNAAGTALTASKIYKHAYKGKPQQILAYRMATSDAAKGTCSLGTDSTVIETLYPSDRAFTAIVKANVLGGQTLEIVEGGVKLLSIDFTTLEELQTAVNASNLIRVATAGTALPTNTAGTAFTGGNNGATVTATEYNAFLSEVEADRSANAFSLDGVSDAAIVANVVAWLKRVRVDGLYITFVNGGAAAWDTDGGVAANAVSTTYNYKAIVNVGNGCDGYPSADMAIFVAARIASVDLSGTLTDEVVPYSAVNKRLNILQRKSAVAAGTLVFVQNGKTIVIDEGINTYTNVASGDAKSYGKIKVNTIMDTYSKDTEAFGEAYKKGLNNTDEARAQYAEAVADTYLKAWADKGIIKDDYFYVADPDYYGETATQTAALDEAYFLSALTPVDSMEKIYQKTGVNFN